MASLGIPLKILHEAEGHTVTVESITNEIFRGKLVEAEDNMNIQMSEVTMTARDGKTSHLTNVYIRGSKIRFIIMPDMLKNVPMLKSKPGTKGLGSGRGKTVLIRAQVRGGRGRGMRGGSSRGGAPFNRR